MPEWVHEEYAESVEHLDHPENEGLVWAAALFYIRLQGGGGDLQGKGASDDKHGLCLDNEE